ncbi:BTAD domain-containing putative transcriptional regulator [Streptomyces gamaensis]|uniref:BTAD domain-containing putative transcriptional regulator n=1 Tax=Streptomyces gamaensis TaxID=1763542 RepID=A0ABW0Z5F4_9ACTN
MRYGILGTTQAHTADGHPVALGGARLRALLAALALHPGRTRGTETLIDEVWQDEPPADAAGALQALVGRLRRALGHQAVGSAAGGYRLCAEPDDVDLHRFARLADEAAGALADDDPVKAGALADDALALWRGPALADLPDREGVAGRYEARLLDVRRVRLHAALALGRAAESLAELTELCADHPLDEPLQALRLRALRATGRPAAALAAYEEIRTLLADRLGTDPGPELRLLHTELLGPKTPGAPARSGPPASAAAPAAPEPGSAPAGGGRAVRPGGAGARDAGGGAHAGVPDEGFAASAPAGGGRAARPGGAGARDAGDGAHAGVPDEDFAASTPAGGERAARPGGAGTPDSAAGAPACVPGAGFGAAAPAVPGGAGVSPTAGSGASGDAVTAAGGAGRAAPADGERARPGGAPAGVSGEGFAASAPAVPGEATAPPTAGSGASGDAVTAVGGTGRAAAPGGEHAALPGSAGAPARGAGAPAPGRATRPPGNLRARLTSFVGREDDIGLIRGDLARYRLVTLLGPGGAGKTRLSQEAAEAAAGGGAWPDGVWFAELAPLDDPETVPEAVLTALGARETVVRAASAEGLRAAAGDASALDPLVRLAEHCAARRMLLVLDNCEHVVDAAARLAETLLAHCPGVTVLATSREPLAVPGESVRPVEPLPDPVALRLLADRGAAARPGFRTEDDPEACAEICRRLDGLPLAIELAAARLRLLTPRGLADRLDDRFRLLTSGSRTVLPRQQTLRAVVDWSWDLLDGPERAVLRRLSVFSGGCDLAAAEAVCSDDGEEGEDGEVSSRDVAVLLGSLVDKSLVVAAPAADGAMRYRLLETVGEYAAERLTEAGDRTAAERRHLVHYRELARTADPLLRGPRQAEWLDRLELEHDNLRTALRRAVAAEDEQEALCLVLSLGWFWQLRDHRADGRTLGGAAAALGPDPFAEPVEPAPPLYVSCTAAPPPMGPELLQEARRGVHLIALANSETDMRVFGEEAVQRRLRAIIDTYEPGLPQNCRVPGMMWFYARLLVGDLAGLDRSLDRLERLCRELGYDWELAHILQMRAKFRNENRDHWAEGARDADESLALFRRLGDAWGVAEALSGRAESRERRGEFEAAAEDYRAAIDSARDLGANNQVPLLRARLADALLESGAIGFAEAEAMLREAVAGAQQTSSDGDFFARVVLGVVLVRSGRAGEARVLFEDLLREFGNRHIDLFQGMMAGLLAWVDIVEGRPRDALPKVREALEKSRDPLVALVAGQLPAAQLTHGALAHAELARAALADGAPGGAEHAVRAARLLGAASTALPRGYYEPSVVREVRERAEAGALAALGPEAYGRARAEGSRLTPVEAAAFV